MLLALLTCQQTQTIHCLDVNYMDIYLGLIEAIVYSVSQTDMHVCSLHVKCNKVQ